MKLKNIPIKQHINELMFGQLILHSNLHPELNLYSSMVLKVNDSGEECFMPAIYCHEDDSAFISGDINGYKSNKEALTEMNRMIIQANKWLE